MASSSSAAVVVAPPTGVSFNSETKVLCIDEIPVKIFYFGDEPSMPWFQAKPVHSRLGATKIGQTLARVSDDRKSSLQELINVKGQPLSQVGLCDNPTFGYHDLKAIYVNEPGLYDILLGSHKEEAQAFRNWVTGEVLPALRRTGTYSVQKSDCSEVRGPLDLDAAERDCVMNADMDPEMAARLLQRIALARRLRQSDNFEDQALSKRQRTADVVKYEAEAESAAEKYRTEAQAAQLERARIQAEKQKIEDTALADKEERERARVHAAELDVEKRREEVRRAAESGTINTATASALLAEDRRTPIVRFEQWIKRVLKCPNSSKCSSVLMKSFNEAVVRGEHIKPGTHKNDVSGSWMLYEEHDGPTLNRLHQEIHDRRNGVQPGQSSLRF